MAAGPGPSYGQQQSALELQRRIEAIESDIFQRQRNRTPFPTSIAGSTDFLGHPVDGDALVWSQTEGKWIPGTSGGFLRSYGQALANIVGLSNANLGGVFLGAVFDAPAPLAALAQDTYANGPDLTASTGGLTAVTAGFYHVSLSVSALSLTDTPFVLGIALGREGAPFSKSDRALPTVNFGGGGHKTACANLSVDVGMAAGDGIQVSVAAVDPTLGTSAIAVTVGVWISAFFIQPAAITILPPIPS